MPAGGADGFVTKLPPAGVLTGIKILPYKEANGPEKIFSAGVPVLEREILENQQEILSSSVLVPVRASPVPSKERQYAGPTLGELCLL